MEKSSLVSFREESREESLVKIFMLNTHELIFKIKDNLLKRHK